jgi:hypothetical protein
MKYIKSRYEFLKESKLKDIILDTQKDIVKDKWGSKYLDYEEVDVTEKINQGKWKLSEEDKIKVLNKYFDCNFQKIYDIFSNLSNDFCKALKDSLKMDLITDEKYIIIMENFDPKSPTIEQIATLYKPILRKINVSDTTSTEIIKKDENGRPIRDESGNMVKISKKENEIVYSNNLVSINGFISSYINCFESNEISEVTFMNNDLDSFINIYNLEIEEKYSIDFKIFDKDIYLSISHNPKDILNMSVSKFYSSCMNLHGGCYREKVLINVFDPNSIPAFLVFETPIYMDSKIISEHLPLCRMMLRNIEIIDDDNKETCIYFDRTYPDRMYYIMQEMVEKYSKNEKTNKDLRTYYLTPDINCEDDLSSPYMDNLELRKSLTIGKNTKYIKLSQLFNWSDFKILPNNKLKTIIIETPIIPNNSKTVNLNLDTIVFKYLHIFDLNYFENLKVKYLGFEKCRLNTKCLREYDNVNDIKTLSLVGCKVDGDFNTKIFNNLNELKLLYTMEKIEDVYNLIKDTKIKKLIISSDLIRNKKSRPILDEIKKIVKNIKIEGPSINKKK